MSRRSRPRATLGKTVPPRHLEVRRAKRSDIKGIADLFVRLKKLNNEFDPIFGVVADAGRRAEDYISSTFGLDDAVLAVATSRGKVIGAVRAELRDRLFYQPEVEGRITEMYILPEHRRMDLGRALLDCVVKELKGMGAEIIVAELPVRNEIGVSFYTKRGFRRLSETFAQAP